MAYNNTLPKKSENVSDWYNAIVVQAELAEYGPAKGTMIFRPYGYAIWEAIQKELDARIKDKGVDNVYFPMFIPESLLNKEAEHIEGFAPELAVVTIGGGEELNERLIVRPTSETIICSSFSKWVTSWRDLPMCVNQWANVVRWEKRTYMFLRTTEFLWQEGHTIHASHAEATEMQEWAMGMYKQIFREHMALPGIVGRKSESEKFAGADMTLTYEILMPDGKALQSCTSHDLGQNFAKSFDIAYSSKEGTREFVWQTSWGLSTRVIGGLVLGHGDDQGLRLPPKMAPVQVVIIPVRAEDDILAYCEKLAAELKVLGVRAKVDARDESIGFRINKWEMKGVPVRLEIGRKEIEAGTVTVGRRDTGVKESLPADGISETLVKLLDEIQAGMLAESEKFLADNTHSVETYDEFKAIMAGPRGFIKAMWCEDADCEAAIKNETKATTRCLESGTPKEEGTCVRCGKPASYRWHFAQSY